MQNLLELPIGATAEVFGKKVECVRNTSIPCNGCCFEKSDDDCSKIACYPDERKTDDEYIILKELNE